MIKTIDFTKSPPITGDIYAGELGEQEAVTLRFIPETDMSEDEDISFYYVRFAVEGGCQNSRTYGKTETIDVDIWDDLTEEEIIECQLIASNSTSSIIKKSPIIQLMLGDSIYGPVIGIDDDHDTVMAQIADLEAKKHTHSNKTQLDKISEASGKLKYDNVEYQPKLSSANAGTNVTITEEGGVIKISSTGGGTSNFDDLTNRPKYNGSAMTHETNIPEVKSATWNAKQEALVSGTNIKTINNQSILGSGNIDIQGIGVYEIGSNTAPYIKYTATEIKNLAEAGNILTYNGCMLQYIGYNTTYNRVELKGLIAQLDVTYYQLYVDENKVPTIISDNKLQVVVYTPSTDTVARNVKDFYLRFNDKSVLWICKENVNDGTYTTYRHYFVQLIGVDNTTNPTYCDGIYFDSNAFKTYKLRVTASGITRTEVSTVETTSGSQAKVTAHNSDNSAHSSLLSAKQNKLTSANAGTNVTITEVEGVTKINASGGNAKKDVYFKYDYEEQGIKYYSSYSDEERTAAFNGEDIYSLYIQGAKIIYHYGNKTFDSDMFDYNEGSAYSIHHTANQQLVTFTGAGSSNIWFYYEISNDDKEDIFRYSDMPTASASYLGKIVEYIGTTDSTYTKGYFYECVDTSVQESITATQTDNGVTLGTITLNNATVKSMLSAGIHEFVFKGYNTVLNFSNISAFPPVTYQVTRDGTFDRQIIGVNNSTMYSWVDSDNQFYLTNTLQPNALTKLYLLNVTTGDLTDTNATFISSNTPSLIEGRWTKKEGDVYTDVEISDYGILLSSSGLPGNTIKLTYVQANTSYGWQQKNVQPSSGSGTGNYNDLTNKPKINNVELTGNKSASDLSLQSTLVSGTNIKTINNNSILGSGNIEIQGGGNKTSVIQSWDTMPTNPSIGDRATNVNDTGSDYLYHEYSTTEHIVGKWIDGKTIYEKTYHLTGDFYRQTLSIDTTLNKGNIGWLKMVDCCMKRTEGGFYEASHIDNSFGWVQAGSNAILYYLQDNTDHYAEIWVTIQYTKGGTE